MNDMPKQQYLTKDDKGWKLRRRVPKHLQKLAGKGVWAKRLSGIDYKTACEEARVFGVWTDAEKKRLETELKNIPVPKEATSKDEPGFKFHITDHEIDQLAIAYFHELEKPTRDGGGYRKGVTKDNRIDVLIELAEDAQEADAILIGDQELDMRYPDRDIQKAFHYRALNHLVEYGYLDRGEFEEVVERTRRGGGKKYTHLKLPNELAILPEFQRLTDRMAEANAEISRRSLEAVSDNRHPSLQNPLFNSALKTGYNPSVAVYQHKMQLLNAITLYKDKRSVEVGEARMSDLQIPLKALEEVAGAKIDLGQISKKTCQEIADLLIIIPPYSTNHYNDKPLRETVIIYEKKHGEKANRPKKAREGLAIIKDFFGFCIQQDWIDINPASNIEIPVPKRPKKFDQKNEGYQPYTLDELRRIFNAPIFTGCKNDEAGYNRIGNNIVKRHRYWAPIIALYTGMRSGEILQLEREDIQQMDGIHFFSVTDEENVIHDFKNFTKRLKNPNAVRDIPLHPELIKMGFLAWLDNHQSGRIFREAKPGSNGKLSSRYSKHYGGFGRKLGVWECRRKVFHSFRNNFQDVLKNGRVILEHRIAINGWEAQHEMDESYGRGYKVQLLHDEMCKAKYDDLDLSHLYV